MSFAEWIAKFGKIKLGKFQLIVVNSFVVVLFFPVFPYLMYLLRSLDVSLCFGEFNSGLLGFVVAIIFTLVGMSFALWTISSQLFIGKGSPIPLLPTQKLIIKALYRYSRNPLVFGGFFFLYVVTIIFESISCLIFTTLFFSWMLAYIKLVEEKELTIRFGGEYLYIRKSQSF